MIPTPRLDASEPGKAMASRPAPQRMRAPRIRAAWASGALCVLLAACGSTPETISLPSSRGQAAQLGDLRVENVKWDRTQPGCKKNCPSITVDSVAFPGIPKLTALVDHVLAYMTGTDQNMRNPYDTLEEFAAYFWKTARPGYSANFNAKVKDTVGSIVVVELHTEQYLGGAHGIPATQYMNWQRTSGRVLALDEVIISGRRPQFIAALRQAHAKWLAGNDDAKRDPAAYARLWPFVDNDNFALTPQGVTMKYQAYSIAPYVYGEPEISIPYSSLVGILRPEYIPAKS